MDNLKIEETEFTLGVSFDLDTHKLEFKGESRPENCFEFYDPIIKWLDNYVNYLYYITGESKNLKLTINIDFKIIYFNSTSAKFLLDIIMLLSKINKINNVTMNYNWYYKKLDEDIKESGEEFSNISDIPFNFIEY